MAKTNWAIALTALLTTIVVSLFGKGLLRLIPIFAGIIVGYIAAIVFGIVDFQPIIDAPWFALPAFVRPAQPDYSQKKLKINPESFVQLSGLSFLLCRCPFAPYRRHYRSFFLQLCKHLVNDLSVKS